MIRFFDILFSFLGILFLSPVFLFLYIAIRLESKGVVSINSYVWDVEGRIFMFISSAQCV